MITWRCHDPRRAVCRKRPALWSERRRRRPRSGRHRVRLRIGTLGNVDESPVVRHARRKATRMPTLRSAECRELRAGVPSSAVLATGWGESIEEFANEPRRHSCGVPSRRSFGDTTGPACAASPLRRDVLRVARRAEVRSGTRQGPPTRLRRSRAASFAWLAEPKLTLRR